MKTEEKRRTGKMILLGAIMILIVFGFNTYARLSSSVQGTGNVDIASLVDGSEFTAPNDSLPKQPGDFKILNFTVSNEKNGEVSETKLTYGFIIETAENIPFTFQLSKDDGSTWTDIPANTLSLSGNEFSLSAKTDNWQLKITWPKNENDDKYIELIDYVRIQVKMEQKIV